MSLRKILAFIAVAIVGFIGIKFLSRDAFHYFRFTEQSYSPYFWSRAGILFPHVLFGMTAFVLGPLQFIPGIRKKYVRTHRALGKIYLVCIAISAPFAIWLAFTSAVNFVYASGLIALASVWLTTSLMAYLSIRKGLITLHREWMVRSYVVTFAFGTFRFWSDILEKLNIGQENNIAVSFLAWSCWSIPLFATEVIFQSQRLSRVKRMTVRRNVDARKEVVHEQQPVS